jgi:diguanylate cyclase (GGDEF)-like protein
MDRAPQPHDERHQGGGRPRGLGVSARWLATLSAAVLACTAVSLLGAMAVARSDAQRARLAFRGSASQIASSLGTAIEHEEDLVVSASAYIAEHPHVSPAGFDQWATSVHALARYPELQNFGLVELVPRSQLQRFEAQLAANPVLAVGGRAAQPAAHLRILPPGRRPYYCFATAGLARSQATYIPAGVDYCALAPGLLPSRETGRSSYAPFQVAAGMTTLGVEIPVYRGGITPTTLQGRLHGFVGWLGELLTPSVVLAKAVQGYPAFAVKLTYGSAAQGATFSSGRAPAHRQSQTIDLHNGWVVEVIGPGAETKLFTKLNSTLILLGGIVLTLLVAALFFVLTTSRQRALAMVAEKTRELSHQAMHDSLTGLPNRALVLERARTMLARSRREENVHTGVLFIDIDGFKGVNDFYGHYAGDQVLQTVSERLMASVRGQDTVGRLGGDEFVVLAESDGDPNGLRAVARRIIEALRQPMTLEDDTPLLLTASIGIASGQHDSPEQLLREADIALYRAKAEGKDRYVEQAPALP